MKRSPPKYNYVYDAYHAMYDRVCPSSLAGQSDQFGVLEIHQLVLPFGVQCLGRTDLHTIGVAINNLDLKDEVKEDKCPTSNRESMAIRIVGCTTVKIHHTFYGILYSLIYTPLPLRLALSSKPEPLKRAPIGLNMPR